MKKTYIVSHPFTGSVPGSLKLKGYQLASLLSEYNDTSCVSLSPKEMLTIRDSNILFLGTLSGGLNLTEDILETLKRNGNSLHIDPIDDLCYNPDLQKEVDLYNLLDSVIVPNSFVRDYLTHATVAELVVLPHHYDLKFQQADKSKLKHQAVFYGGSAYSNPYLMNPPQWLHVDVSGYSENMFINFCKYPTHFSHRMSNTLDFLLKPSTKLSTAAAALSPLITSRDKSFVDILPQDYPLFVEDNQDSVYEVYEFVLSVFNTPRWKSLVDVMREVEMITRPQTIAKRLNNLFKNI